MLTLLLDMREVLFCCLVLLLQTSTADDYYGCIGSEKSCGDKLELFPGDSLTLETTHNDEENRLWKDRVVIARQSDESYSACIGCTISVKFINYTSPLTTTLTLLQANYTPSSYVLSETVYLRELVTFGGEIGKQPTDITTTGTVLKIAFDGIEYSNYIKIYVTTNVPPEKNHDMGPLIGISAVVTTLILTSYAIGLKIRRQRLARMRAEVDARVSAMVVDAALDAAVLRQARASSRRAPHSPDPTDSVAPPSYEEAAPPPPKYEDIVMPETQADEPPTTPADGPNDLEAPSPCIDPAGADHGNDTDMLVV